MCLSSFFTFSSITLCKEFLKGQKVVEQPTVSIRSRQIVFPCFLGNDKWKNWNGLLKEQKTERGQVR